MSTDIASLKLEVDSTQTVKASEALDRLDASGRKVAASTDAVTNATTRQQASMGKLSADQKLINDNYARYKAEQDRVIEGTIGLSTATQRLLDRYDPLGTKLRALQADFARLNAEVSAGAGSGSESAIDKTYSALNSEIAKTEKLMAQAGVATATTAVSMQSLGLNTAFARRELLVLGHEAMQGNFSRMPGSFMTLAGHSNILSLALNPVAIGIVGVSAAAIGMAVAFEKGHHEIVMMENALQSTSNFAGMTRGQMVTVAQAVADVGTITIGTSKEMVTQIVASGRYSAENIGLLARLTENYAGVSGEAIDKTTPKLIKMFEDPAKASEMLNQQYHYLSVAELDRIRNLQMTGRQQDAVTEAIKALDAHLPNHAKNIGVLESAWNKVVKQMSAFWDTSQKIMNGPSLEDQIASAQQNIGLMTGPNARMYGGADALADERTRLAALQKKLNEQIEAAAKAAEVARARDEENKASALVRQTSEYVRIRDLQAEIALIQKSAPDSPDKTRAIFDKQKQILEIQRGIGAEGRALTEQRIASELRLFEVQNKGVIDNIEAQLKLGNITKAESEKRRLDADLAMNEARQLAITRQLGMSMLTALEKEKLAVELQSLTAAANLRRQQYDNSDLIERNRLLTEQAAVDAKASQATTEMQMKVIAGYDEQIERIKEHNAQIGKTKEQIDRLKAAEVDRKIAAMEFMRGVDQDGEPGDSAYLQRLDREIAKLKEIRDLQLKGAAAEGQFAVQKKQAEEFNNLFQTVERTGKEVFIHIFSDGKNAFEGIGKAIKASVIDLLYQLTARKWLINIGASVAGSMGMSTAGTAMASAGTGGIGGVGGLSSLFSLDKLSSGVSMFTSGADSIFQTAGVEMGSQFLADIGNYNFGLPVLSGIVMALSGNVAGGIGSTIGGIAGSYFGPIGTAIGSWLGGQIGSMFNDGPERQAQVVGQGMTASASEAGGLQGSMVSFLGSSRSDLWGGASWTAIGGETVAKANLVIKGLFDTMRQSATALGLDTSKLKDISVAVSASFDGMVNSADLQTLFTNLSDTIIKTLVPNITKYQQAEETLAQTYGRLAAAVGEVQLMFDVMENGLKATFDISNSLANMFGGSDKLKASFDAYYQGFFSEAERNAITLRQITAQFSALGLVTPTSKEQFRQMVEALDLTNTSGQAVFKVLMDIAPAFAQLADAALLAGDAALTLSQQLTAAQKDAQEAVSAQIKTSQDAATTALRAADAYRGLTETLADAVRTLRGGDLSTLLPGQKLSEARTHLDSVFGMASTGDAAALGDLPGVATAFLQASRDYNASSQAYTDDFDRVMSMLAQAGITSGTMAGVKDYQATLLQAQTNVLEQIRDQLEAPSPDAGILEDQRLLLESIGSLLSSQTGVILTGNSIQDAIKDIGALNKDLSEEMLRSLVTDSVTQTNTFESMLTSVTETTTLLQRLVDIANEKSAEEAQAAADAKVKADAAIKLASEQSKLTTMVSSQAQLITSVNAGIAGINALASQYGLSLQTSSGAPANFSVSSDGIFDGGGYNQIYGNPANFQAFKDQFWAPGGVYDQTFGKAAALQSLADSIAAQRAVVDALLATPGHASGLSYVPRDNYLMRAHVGEAVLTAPEAATWRSGGNGMSKADIDRLCSAVNDARDAILYAAETSSREMKEQTSQLANASKESAREMGNTIAGAVDVKTLV